MKLVRVKYLLFSFMLSLVFASVFIKYDNIFNSYQTSWYFYFIALASIILIVVSLNFIFSNEESNLSLNVIDLFVILFFVYSFIRLLFTENETLNNKQFLSLLFLTALYFIWKEFVKKNIKDDVISLPAVIFLSIFLLSGFIEALIGILQLYDIIPGYVNSYFKVNGSFVNPDNYSGYLAITLCFSFAVYKFLHPDSWKTTTLKYLALVTFLASLFLLPVLRERGGIIAAAGGIIFIYLSDKKVIVKIRRYTKTILRISIALSALIIILFFSVKILYKVRPRSADGRLLMWKVTGSMIKDNPLFGLGFDRFASEYNNYQAKYFLDDQGSDYEKLLADNVKQAHNEYLQIWSEIGIIGLLLLIGIIVSALWGYRKNDLPPPVGKSGNSQHTIISNAAKASFVSLLIYSLFSFPFHILPIFIIFFFLLSLISACSSVIIFNFKISVNRKFIMSFAIILLFFSGFILAKNYRLFNSYKKWNEANLIAYPGLYNNSIEMLEKLYPELKNNGEFLFNYGGVLTLNKNYNKAIGLLEESKKNYSDPKQYINLGICYESMKNYKEAEKNYEYSSNMIPNLLYPKYLLAKLLIKEEKMEKAKILCDEILESNTKVNSTAVYQMKKELRILLASLETELRQR